MSQDFDDTEEDWGGFDVDDWTRLVAFKAAVATLEDVQAKRAIFALGDTECPRLIDMDLPQPVIWWEDEGEQAAVAVQAEAHTGNDGEEMEVLGLILPDGSSLQPVVVNNSVYLLTDGGAVVALRGVG